MIKKGIWKNTHESLHFVLVLLCLLIFCNFIHIQSLLCSASLHSSAPNKRIGLPRTVVGLFFSYPWIQYRFCVNAAVHLRIAIENDTKEMRSMSSKSYCSDTPKILCHTKNIVHTNNIVLVIYNITLYQINIPEVNSTIETSRVNFFATRKMEVIMAFLWLEEIAQVIWGSCNYILPLSFGGNKK